MRKDLAEAARKAQQHALKVALVKDGSSFKKGHAASSKKPVVPSTKETLVVKARDFKSVYAERRSMSRKRSRAVPPSIEKPQSKENVVNVEEFVNSHRREVGRFGANALDKRNKRSFETAELVKLGCRPPKNEKMPIWLLQGRRKKEKERAAQQKELDLASGMLVRSKRRSHQHS